MSQRPRTPKRTGGLTPLRRLVIMLLSAAATLAVLFLQLRELNDPPSEATATTFD